MKVAIPVAEGRLNLHFGHCVGFDVFDIADDKKTISSKTYIEAPPHEPGLLPQFLGDKGITHIIAGGMGVRARDLFVARGITVCTGAQCDTSDSIIGQYLAGTLITGANACDH
ncbi:MAG TPA: NifB/NifX family molybdenum-iron cluster-binding protein [Treponemataceae bacterium]|nr:NifB/NifX family molybdenum-iron cluster-binding protein [Treponemataceae bacterium]